MAITIIRGSEVNRPTPDALTSSVLDHVVAAGNLVSNAQFGMRNNEGLWPSYNCIDTLVPTPICPDPMNVGKTFMTAGWVPGLEFAIHGGVKCGAVSLDVADQKAEIERVFRLNEGKGIEQVLLFNRFVATDSDSDIQWDAPTDLTPGAAVDLKTALAILEGYAASIYAGVPTIHMSRAAGSLLGERIVWKGDLAYTRSGSKVAMGGGYDTPEVPDATWDLYATGEVYVEQAETISVQTHVIPGDGNGVGSDETGHEDNMVLALVERMFRVGVDCFVAKVTGTAWTV